MARGLWTGAISFGLVNIPVSLFSGEKREELQFSLLDRRDFAPVGYQRINKETGAEVPWAEIVKGYEYEDGQYVVMGDEDFRQANVKATQTIDIVDFVDENEIPRIYYEKPYFLTPGKKGEKGYALLRETLSRSKRVGIAKVVIRTKQHLAAVYPMEDFLVLNILRFADEIRSTEDLEVPAGDLRKLGVSEKELDMAERLVEGMATSWQPESYRDDYREDLLALIERKVEEGQTHVVSEPTDEEAPATAEVIDLMALLKRSVQQTSGERSEKSSGKAKTHQISEAKAKKEDKSGDKASSNKKQNAKAKSTKSDESKTKPKSSRATAKSEQKTKEKPRKRA